MSKRGWLGILRMMGKKDCEVVVRQPKWWSATSGPNIGFWSTSVGMSEKADADRQCRLEITGETQLFVFDAFERRTRVSSEFAGASLEREASLKRMRPSNEISYGCSK